MFGHRRLRPEPVHPDLPVTPMLDMSFQLLAFFVFTFRPAPVEGGFHLKTVAATENPVLNVNPLNQPARFIVRAEANKDGTLKSLSLRDADGIDAPREYGTSLLELKAGLKTVYDSVKGKAAKLTLQVDPRLPYAKVVELLDVGIAAGFTSIAPVPLK